MTALNVCQGSEYARGTRETHEENMFFIKAVTFRLLQAHILRKLILASRLSSVLCYFTVCVLLTISYHQYFLRMSKFWLRYITGHISGGEFGVKNVSLCLHILLGIFFVFHQKKFVFLSFSSLFLTKYQ